MKESGITAETSGKAIVRGGDKMNKKQSPPPKKRGATVAAVLCFVAAIAIVGTYTLGNSREARQNEKLAKTEETQSKEETTKSRGVGDGDAGDGTGGNTGELAGAEEAGSLVITNEDDTGISGENVENTDQANPGGRSTESNSVMPPADTTAGAQQTAGQGVNISFGEDSKLLWPVNGTVLMSFSMDKTMYFSTLDQYKYNPAVIISAAENDQVIAGTTGIVKSIDNIAETGTTVNIDIGNGYELFYGQLKDVQLKTGDYVEANSVIGYVSAPTKYYSTEGPNVYFEMRKDGQPINPVDYM